MEPIVFLSVSSLFIYILPSWSTPAPAPVPYLFHLPVISYKLQEVKNLGLCEKTSVLLEYEKKLELSICVKHSVGYSIALVLTEVERIHRPVIHGNINC